MTVETRRTGYTQIGKPEKLTSRKTASTKTDKKQLPTQTGKKKKTEKNAEKKKNHEGLNETAHNIKET